jgi:CheY-like chemotaxis protein
MTPHKRTLVILGSDAALHGACVAALAGHTEVFDEGYPDRPHQPDFVLIPLREPLLPCIELFATQRRTQARVPILLCGADLPVEVVVELIKAGAVDFVGLPIVPEVLRRKLERAQTGRYVLALDEPAFASLLSPLDRSPMGQGPTGGAASASLCPRTSGWR